MGDGSRLGRPTMAGVVGRRWSEEGKKKRLLAGHLSTFLEVSTE